MTSHHSVATALAHGRLYAYDQENAEEGEGTRRTAAAFSGEEAVERRPVHPDSKTLFEKCDGKMNAIRYIPLFGQAIEAFGYKLVGALNLSEFLSKGVANYTLQNSYYPMFCTRFGAGAMAYQRYQNVAMMGWSIKPLTALISDSLALFRFSKRWYMVISAVAGAVCCFAYASLPAKTSSGPTAAAFLFLTGYCQGNLDILAEGFYSRLMRQNPLAGPALVSTVWWMLSLGNIVASFTEGPLSDAGREAVGAYIAGVCMVATVPLFALNLYGERPNRVERQADAIALRAEERRLRRIAAKATNESRVAAPEEEEGRHSDLTSGSLDARVALKNAELQQAGTGAALTREGDAPATIAAAGVQGCRELASDGNDGDACLQDLIGFSMDLAGPHVGDVDGRAGGASYSADLDSYHALCDDTVEPVVAGSLDGESTGVGEENDEDALTTTGTPRIRSLCCGAVEFNEEVVTRNWRIVVYAMAMTVGVVALAVVTILPGMYPLLGTCVGVSLAIPLLSFWALPVVVAKASLFAFLNQMFYVQVTGPLNSFYLATPECLPDGPHFSYLFYNTITSVIGSVANMAGVTLFTYVFSKRSYRITFIVTILFEIAGSIFDLIMVKRWNVAMHIPDHVMYVCGDAVVYQVAYMLNWMPMVVLLSQLCPRGSESIVYALLAGFSNVGGTMATEVGTLLMDFVWPVKTTPASACDFKNLPILIVVCHLCAPLLQIPLVFLLIPGARVCDELDSKGNVIGEKGHTDRTKGGTVHEESTTSLDGDHHGSAATGTGVNARDATVPLSASQYAHTSGVRNRSHGGGAAVSSTATMSVHVETGYDSINGDARAQLLQQLHGLANVSMTSARRSGTVFGASTSVRMGAPPALAASAINANASVTGAGFSRSGCQHRYQPIPLAMVDEEDAQDGATGSASADPATASGGKHETEE